MPLIKNSKNSLKFIEVESEESIYNSINSDLKILFDYLKNYKETMKVPDAEVRFTYCEIGDPESDFDIDSMLSDIEVNNSNDHEIIEIDNCSNEEKNYEELHKKYRTDFFILSFVVILCSIFEKSMEKIIYKIKRNKNLKFNLKVPGRGLVSSYKKFLIQYGKIGSIDKKLWDILFDIITIRNLIVHSDLDSVLNDGGRDFRLTGKYLPCHGVYHESEIIFLSWHFCEFSLKIINCFFKQLQFCHLLTLKRNSDSLQKI